MNIEKQHPAKAIECMKKFLKKLDDWELTAVETLVSNSKSALLAIAIYHNRIDVDTAIRAAQIEQDVQTVKWGEMENGHDLETLYNKIEISAGTFFLNALKFDKIK